MKGKKWKKQNIPKQYMDVFNKKYLIKKTTINKYDSNLEKNKKIIIKFLFETGIRAIEIKNIIEF